MVLCNQCGNGIADGFSFCTECGGPVGESPLDARRSASEIAPTPQPEPSSQIETRKLRFFGYAGASILVFVLGVSAAVLFYQRQNENRGATTKTAAMHAGDASPVLSPSRSTKQGRYSVASCGAIQDSQTDLEWFVGPDRNVTWYDAQNWVTGMGSCGGGWRMPTIQEIGTLYDPSQRAGTGYYKGGRNFPAHVDPVFSAIGGGSWVWSGESVAADSVRSFNLHLGEGVVYSPLNTLYSTRAFAVRNLRSELMH